MHYCPGCKGVHAIYVERPNGNGARWTFDGNMDSPTFGPSIRCYTTDGHWDEATRKWIDGPNERTLCHYFLQGGMLNYCSDSPHALAGKSVPLPFIPDNWIH